MSIAACLIEGDVRVMRARPAKEDGGEDNVSNIPNIDVNTLSIIILFECGVLFVGCKLDGIIKYTKMRV